MNKHEQELIDLFCSEFDVPKSKKRIISIDLHHSTDVYDSILSEQIYDLLTGRVNLIDPNHSAGHGLILYSAQSGIFPEGESYSPVSMGQSGFTEGIIYRNRKPQDLEDFIINGNTEQYENGEVEAIKTMAGRLLNKLLEPISVKEVYLYYPPIPETVDFPDFEKILNPKVKDGRVIHVRSFSELMDVKPDETLFFILNYRSSYSSATIISGYTNEDGKTKEIGSLLRNEEGSTIRMHSVSSQEHSFKAAEESISNQKFESTASRKNALPLDLVQTLSVLTDQTFDFQNFINRFSSGIYGTKYLFKGGAETGLTDPTPTIENKLKRFGRAADTFSPLDAAVYLLGSEMVSEISLWDLSVIADFYQRNKEFKASDLIKKQNKIKPIHLFRNEETEIDYRSLPADFYEAKISTSKNYSTEDYFDTEWSRTELDRIIETIISHYSPCRLEDIADDLIALHNDAVEEGLISEEMFSETVNIQFLADLFVRLLQIDSVSISPSINKYVVNTKLDKGISRIKGKTAKKSRVINWNIPLEEVGLGQRAYNSLKRAGITNCADLQGFTMYQLMHVRNLGKKGAKEVRDKLYSLGLIIQ